MYAKYTITDYDSLEPHQLQRVWDECNELEETNPDLSTLNMRQLEALIWFYRALQTSWIYEGVNCPSENREFHREKARCAEIEAHVFQRQYEREKSAYKAVLAEQAARVRKA